MNNDSVVTKNPLGTEDIGRLLRNFAVPSIIAMLVSALYNIVDQIFIGQGIGILGNAATNVAFPTVTISTAFSLLFGVGGASNFNLSLGRGKKDDAMNFAGNAVTISTIVSLITVVTVLLFLEKLLLLFGATEQVLPYAKTYLVITIFGTFFTTFAIVGSNLIRADGSPGQAMINTLSGAIINTILDPIFIFVFDWNIAGAAWATIIGQFVSAVLVYRYLRKFRTANFKKSNFIPKKEYIISITKLGSSSFFNQIAITLVQITLNNSLKYYGGLSKYGADIPLASSGIVTKVNMMVFAITIGIAQGNQPIVSFNYGAKNYERVRKAILLAITYASTVSVIGFLFFQIFPVQIISVFGEGSEEYFLFATRYIRIFLFMTFINGIQPVASQFFTSIGKAGRGLFVSLTRQILLLIPLIIFLPKKFGIVGILYSAPIADFFAAIISIAFIRGEIAHFDKAIGNKNKSLNL